MPNDFNHSPRLFVASDLCKDVKLPVTQAQVHYLHNVMRLKVGDTVRLFNGHDGEWRSEVAEASKRSFVLNAVVQTKPQKTEPDLWLCCAPIKKAHFDYMLEKATELGAGTIQPILTFRTQIREVNTDRARATCIEAAEQSERMSIPDIRKPVTLKNLAADWAADRTLIVCAEHGDAMPVRDAFEQSRKKISKSAIIVGPEGGFAADELDMLKQIKNSIFVRLGPRILRADTAAIAALSCWQAICGDWNQNPDDRERD